MLMFC